jgi:lysophospholipase L1-like esterase
VPTLYIAGDSTSTDQPREPFNSWGQVITVFFRPEIAVANHGESGESLRGFVGERRLAKLISAIKPGDWLVIQMGHNDQKERGEGVGAFTTYKQSLKEFIHQAREHGGHAGTDYSHEPADLRYRGPHHQFLGRLSGGRATGR